MWLPHCGQCFRVDGIRDAVRDVANGVGVRSRQTTAMLDVATVLCARPVWHRGGSLTLSGTCGSIERQSVASKSSSTTRPSARTFRAFLE